MEKVVYDNMTWKEVESEFCFDSSFYEEEKCRNETKDFCFEERKKVVEKIKEQRWLLNK